jgi:hypothetical protein
MVVKCGPLKEEHKLQCFENKIVRKISGHKRNEIGKWRA